MSLSLVPTIIRSWTGRSSLAAIEVKIGPTAMAVLVRAFSGYDLAMVSRKPGSSSRMEVAISAPTTAAALGLSPTQEYFDGPTCLGLVGQDGRAGGWSPANSLTSSRADDADGPDCAHPPVPDASVTDTSAWIPRRQAVGSKTGAMSSGHLDEKRSECAIGPIESEGSCNGWPRNCPL